MYKPGQIITFNNIRFRIKKLPSGEKHPCILCGDLLPNGDLCEKYCLGQNKISSNCYLEAL